MNVLWRLRQLCVLQMDEMEWMRRTAFGTNPELSVCLSVYAGIDCIWCVCACTAILSRAHQARRSPWKTNKLFYLLRSAKSEFCLAENLWSIVRSMSVK